MPGIFGLAWSLSRCVSWRHRQWQCCILHNSDSMDALLADRPSTFADITVIEPKDSDCVLQTWFEDLFISLMYWKN